MDSYCPIPKVAIILIAVLSSIGYSQSIDPAIRSGVRVLESNTIKDFNFGVPTFYRMGSDDAPVVLIEFSDYRCTHCSIFHEVMFPKIKKEYIDTGKLFYVAVHFPNRKYPIASLAAEASYCAGVQGRFWEMRDLLFADSLYLDTNRINQLARDLALHMGEFDECMKAETYTGLVAAEKRCGKRVGVTATPSFVLAQKEGNQAVNGRLIKGMLKWSKFNKRIVEMLELAGENR
jgi:protein-disulfide isomerase